MAHGKNAKRWGNTGKQWWGKRPLSGTEVSRKGMKFWKRVLHKIERKQGKKQSDDRGE